MFSPTFPQRLSRSKIIEDETTQYESLAVSDSDETRNPVFGSPGKLSATIV